MTLIEAPLFLSEASQFWVMLACLGHDLGHPGVNNQFLIETSHELALRYNDRSPLENMHCCRMFQIVGDPQANVFAQIEKELYKEMRKGIIAAVLHTDIVKHNEMVRELSLLYQMNSEAFDALEPNPRFTEALSGQSTLILNMLLHGADMCNPMRPWKLCEKYAGKIMEEFFAQGDMEKEKGIPVQVLNDRHMINIANSQVGFIEFMIAPMMESMVYLFAPLDVLANNLTSNVASWCDVWIKETSPPEEAVAKVKARVSKLALRCKAVTRAERAKSGGK
jgi:cAMP-specific phosphodiesterase 4